MNQPEIITSSPEETQEFGARLGELARPGDVFLLVGKLGAGKTCLTQGIARGLGIAEYAASPSFVVARELYGRLPLYHMDFYRLENPAEIADLGLDDYFYGKGVSVVEWAEKGLSLLPPEHLLIEMSYISDTGRRLKLKASGKRYRQLAAELK
jgi:tRNA threonylcarbamoyladenosine biosynthesis protein TsaE